MTTMHTSHAPVFVEVKCDVRQSWFVVRDDVLQECVRNHPLRPESIHQADAGHVRVHGELIFEVLTERSEILVIVCDI